jgi:ATP-dependent helicase/nuclease subunit A
MAAYRAGLRALYPGRAVELSLLWTASASLMILPDEALDAAVARLAAEWTRGGPLLDPPSPPS